MSLDSIRGAARVLAPGKRVETLIALVVLAVAIGLRVAAVEEWSLDLKPRPDALEYTLIAKQIASASAPVLTIDGKQYPSRYPYGTPLCYAPFLALLGGRIDRAFIGTLVYAALALWLTYLVGRRLVGGWGGVLALAITALSPEQGRFSAVVMSEIPSMLMMLVIALLWLWLTRDQRRLAGWALLGLIAGFAGSIRYPNLIALLCLAGDLVWRIIKRRPRAGAELLSLSLGAALSLAAQLAYNTAIFGEPFEDGYRYWEPDDYKMGHPVQFQYVFSPFSPVWPKGNLAFYADAVMGVAHALYRPEVFALLVLGLALTLWSRRRDTLVLLVLLPLATFSFYCCYFFQAYRMLVPVLPFMAMLAALPVARVCERLAAREWARALVVTVVVALLSLRLAGPWRNLLRNAQRERAHASLPELFSLRSKLDPKALIVLDLPLALGSDLLPGSTLMPLTGDGVDRHVDWILEHHLRPLDGSRHAPSPLFLDRELLNPAAYRRIVDARREGRSVLLVHGYLGAAPEMKRILTRYFDAEPYSPGGQTFFSDGLWVFELEPKIARD